MELRDAAASAAGALGVRGYSDALGFGEIRHAVIVLVDGLGWNLLADHAADAPHLAAAPGGSIETAFPSTTPTALASLGTGLLPGVHGLVGGTFWLPDHEVVLNPLHWAADVAPIGVQPEPTVFERTRETGVRVSTIADPKFEHSGLTRAALRGSDYVGVDVFRRGAEQLRRLLDGADRTLTYVYIGSLDRIGHVEGAGSRAWRSELARIDAVVGRLADALPRAAMMLVTADHGMVNCPLEDRVSIERHPELLAGVRLIAGEPRVRQVYTDEPLAVQRRWSEFLGGRADVMLRDALIERGLIGPVEFDVEERLGDVVAVALDSTSLGSVNDERTSSLLGQHGALTSDEMLIPALWFGDVHRENMRRG